jgi:hypothetical protein
MKSPGILICGLLLFSLGCGSENPVAPPPPPNPHPYDGNWGGATSEGHRVQVSIVESRLVYFETNLAVQNGCALVVRELISAPITNREFRFTIRGLGATPTLVTGRMETDTSLRGNIAASEPLTRGFCGAEPGFVKAALTFTADQ